MIRSQSVWVGRGDTSLAGLNAALKEWIVTPEQLIDIEAQRVGENWTLLFVRYETAIVPKLLSSTIHQGAWFQPDYRPTEIHLVFNTPISPSSIETGTFKLMFGTSEANVAASSVTVDKELVTIDLGYPAPGYVGPVTLLGSGFLSETGANAGDAVNLQFSIVDENHLPAFTPANHGHASSTYRYGTLRAARIMVPFGTKPDTMLKGFLAANSIQESQIVKSLYRGSAQAGYTDIFIIWYPLVGIRLVAASPAAWLPSEAAVDRILVNFDQPVELGASEITVTGPGGAVTVTPTAMDEAKTQWKLSGTFTAPGQYHVILDSLRTLTGDYVPFRHAFGWQVMPTEIVTTGGVTDHGALTGLADDDHPQYHNDARGDARYAPIAKGVTNGDTHDHAGGDGAQIDHGGLGGLGDDDHPQYHNDARGDARYEPIGEVAAHVGASDPHTQYQRESEREAANGYAGLDSSSKVIKDPASASVTAGAGVIPKAGGGGYIDLNFIPTMVGDSGSGGVKGLVPAPAAGDAAAGKFLKADGTYAVPPTGGSTPTGTGFRHVTGGVEDGATKLVEDADVHASAAIASSKLADGANIPTSDQKAALAGTNGTPDSGNKYVTNADPRNTNSRAPTGSAGGDLTGGYPNPTVAASAITNTKMADMAQSTIKGRAAGAGTGAPTDLSATQATAILDTVVGDSGSGGTKGLVPAAAAGDGANRLALLANGAFGMVRGVPKAYIGFAGNTSGTYTPSTGTTCFLVRVTGAGAGGGGAATAGGAGGGGGAGGYAEKWYFGPSLSTYSYQGNAGGAAGTAGGGPGGAPAGATTFDTISVPASNGGAGGAAGGAAASNPGGAPSAIPTGGDLNVYGAGGGASIRASAAIILAGNGAPSHFGGGGRGAGVGGGSGENALVFGAGGGGATAAGANQAGGTGGNSLIEIWEFY